MQEDRKKERNLVGVLAAVQFTHIMDFMILMPLGPQLMRVMLISPQQFGLLVSSYTLTAAFASLAVAFYTDRFDRRKTLLVLYAGFVVSTLLCGLAPGYATLLLARAVAGAFGGVKVVVECNRILRIVKYHRQKPSIATGWLTTVLVKLFRGAVLRVANLFHCISR